MTAAPPVEAPSSSPSPRWVGGDDARPLGTSRIGWLWAAVWLVYLAVPIRTAWRAHDTVRGVVAVVALVAFAVGFAAFGLFIGYLVPSENVMQLLGPALALLALMGGIFVPLDQLSDTLQDLAQYTPAYGVGALARAALIGDSVDLGAVANVVIWTAIFAAGAVWRFRRDTARV